jgi:prolyl-tRNA editing enzyme YbaK/EbsC (Cys-tRNA(Pro) deacylase)
VSLFAYATTLRVLIDSDLLQYDEVWAAVGARNDVFGIVPHKLIRPEGQSSPI